MTANPLDAIQARAAAATKGPWRRENYTDIDDEGAFYLAHVLAPDPDVPDEAVLGIAMGILRPDAEFIAASREDVPRLVAALRAVEAVASKWEAEYKDSALNWELMEGVDAGLLIGLNQAAEEARTAITEALS